MRRINYERIIRIMFEQNVGFQTAAEYVARDEGLLERRIVSRKVQA